MDLLRAPQFLDRKRRKTVSYKDLKEAIAGALNPSNLRLFMELEQNLSLVQGFTTTKNQLGDYIRNASDDEIQPLLTYLATAIEADSELLAPATDTVPKSTERRHWVLEKLGLSTFEDALVERMPNPEPALIVEDTFREWYTPARRAANTNYWDDYVRVLSRNGWDAESIGTVEAQATEVMRRIEDPKEPHYLSARGLVVGYVQSGKTANFTAVAAKAIDAGYRFIIILAGTMDNLREQTQRRLDKELCGRESVLSGLDEDDLTAKERKDETYFNDDEEWDRSWNEKGGAFVSHGGAYGSKGFPRIKRVTT